MVVVIKVGVVVIKVGVVGRHQSRRDRGGQRRSGCGQRVDVIVFKVGVVVIKVGVTVVITVNVEVSNGVVIVIKTAVVVRTSSFFLTPDTIVSRTHSNRSCSSRSRSSRSSNIRKYPDYASRRVKVLGKIYRVKGDVLWYDGTVHRWGRFTNTQGKRTCIRIILDTL